MNADSFWEHVLAIGNAYSPYRKKILSQFALTATECDVLLFLAHNPTRDTPAEITRIRRIPKTQVFLAISQLTEKGLVEKNKHLGNKKSVHLSLTEAATPIVEYGTDVQRAFTNMLFDDFTEDEKVIFRRLQAKLTQTAIRQKG